MPNYKLIYFNSKGKAEVARILFAYSETPYEDIRLTKEEFAPKKSTFPFGQIPVLEVDGNVLAQSQAINRFLAKTFHLTGKDEWESAKCDMLIDGLTDVKQHVRPWHREKDESKKKELWTALENEQIKPFLVKYEKFLIENGGEYFVGNKLTWADLVLSDTFSDWNEKFPNLFTTHKKLVEFTQKIQNIPQIQHWIKNRPQTAM